MSRELAPILPPALERLINNRDLQPDGVAFQLVTVRPDGWPYVSLISVGELVTQGNRRLRLALWPKSTATANVARTGKATLATVVEGVPYALRLRLYGPVSVPSATYGSLAAFDADIVEVRADVVPYATVESGIRFRLNDPDDVLPRWAALRESLSCDRR